LKCEDSKIFEVVQRTVMLSILIPIYNYTCLSFSKRIAHSQCLEAKIDFEILCWDDFSSEYLQENQEINTLENCRFREMKLI
jgi:hypothetical protein